MRAAPDKPSTINAVTPIIVNIPPITIRTIETSANAAKNRFTGSNPTVIMHEFLMRLRNLSLYVTPKVSVYRYTIVKNTSKIYPIITEKVMYQCGSLALIKLPILMETTPTNKSTV